MERTKEAPLISDRAALIYTLVLFGVICQILNLFGITTNIINIICFVKQGFEDSVNVSLIGLAVSDLGSLTTMVWTCFCWTPAVAAADLPFDPGETSYLLSVMPHFAFTRVSAGITAMITLERCLCITAPLKVKSIITPRRLTVITVCVFITFTFSGSPVYAVNSLGWTFSAQSNTTRYRLVSTNNRAYVEKVSFAINNFVIPCGSFVVIGVCTIILSFKLRSSTKWRQNMITSSQVDRVSSRNQKAAKMVVMISSLFIVCFIPVSSCMLLLGLLPAFTMNGKYFNISLLIGGLGYILESVNSSMNIFIYYHMSSKYREYLRKFI